VTGVPTLARGSAGVMVLRVWTGEPSIGAGLTSIPFILLVSFLCVIVKTLRQTSTTTTIRKGFVFYVVVPVLLI
jgi:hypothetical protein